MKPQRRPLIVIDQLHSEWSKMDKASRMGYLIGQRIRLNTVANQMAAAVQARGGYMTPEEREQARKLLEIIEAINQEGQKTQQELAGEGIKELLKLMM